MQILQLIVQQSFAPVKSRSVRWTDQLTSHVSEQLYTNIAILLLFFSHYSQAYNLGLESFEAGIFDSLQNIVEMYVANLKLVLVMAINYDISLQRPQLQQY